MTVFLLLYLCSDSTRTDCQVLPSELWKGPNSYEQCIRAASGLADALTAANSERHRFVCEIQSNNALPETNRSRPTFIHQSFRM